MEEITQRERDHSEARWHKQYSAGYIWNQVNGGRNAGVSYQDAFGILTGQGDARLKDFAPDGATDYWIQPGPTARKRASPYRFSSWRSIATTDRPTIQFELSHGRPFAVAMPVYSSTYNHWKTTSWITNQSGSFMFWHSLTVIGYNRYGVELMNSWGGDWGDLGHAMLTYSALVNSGAELVVAVPRTPIAGIRIPRYTQRLPIP